MTATNHAIVGSMVVAATPNPLLGLILALLSHIVLDAIPHFGAHIVAQPSSRAYKSVLITDAFLTTIFLAVITFAGAQVGYPLWLLPLGGLLGWLPDVMWLKHYRSDLSGKTKQWDPLRTFHKKIQRWEVSWGWYVECVWFLVSIFILNRLLFS